MRLASYNVEWFTNLFDNRDVLLRDDGRSGRRGVTRAAQTEALGIVFTALDADAVMIIEAPDTNRHRRTGRALEGFAAAFGLRANRVASGFTSDTQQEIALLYDPAALSVRHDPQGPAAGRGKRREAPRFDSTFQIDLGIDGREDEVRFSKPPLELAVRTASGMDLRMIGAHLKSKAPHGAHSPGAIKRRSVANRRKQLAQAVWLRARIKDHLDHRDPLILMGDLNDGPGLDQYEALLGRSSVEIILGDDLHDPHARAAQAWQPAAMPTTSRFLIGPGDRYLQALLDYVMISSDLMHRRPSWRIWHPFDDPECRDRSDLREALLSASDHFPVTLDIAI